KGYSRGLKLGGILIQRTSDSRVPVEYGILKASSYTRAEGSGFDTKITVGYTADYAGFVHELVGMVLRGKPRPSGIGNYWDPRGKGQAKFLQSAIMDEKDKVQNLVRLESERGLHSL